MPGLVAIWTSLQNAVLETFSPTSAYGAPALGGALLVTALYYASRRRARGRRMSVRGFVRSIFARRIVLHPSSLVDMRLWALNGVVLASAYGMLGFGLFYWRDRIDSGLTGAFGAHAPTPWPVWIILTIATVLQLLAYEFAYWFAHYLFHKIPALWEFHKVHHSAEVMTTFTELRQHPVEIVAFVNLIGLSTGLAFGAMTYRLRPGRAALHPLERQYSADGVSHHLRPLAAQPYVDRVHRARRPRVAEPGASSDCTIPTIRTTSAGIWATRWPCGIGRSARLHSLQDAPADRVRRRRGERALPLRARQLRLAVRALRPGGRASVATLGRRTAGPRRGACRPSAALRHSRQIWQDGSNPPIVLLSNLSDEGTTPCRAKSPRAGAACCWFSIATALWSLAGVFARLVGHLDVWTVLGWRALLGSVSISVVGLIEWRRGRLDDPFGFRPRFRRSSRCSR